MSNADPRQTPDHPYHRTDFRERVEDFADRALDMGVGKKRSQSYDHCYNYFKATATPTADMEKSCAILGFYLASWGMYRGSSYLLTETNSSNFRKLVEYIETDGAALRKVDLDSYDDASMEQVVNAFNKIHPMVLPPLHAAVTLVTKIMCAVFGCIPAYDTYFKTGMKNVFVGQRKSSFAKVSPRSLKLLSELYVDNRTVVDELSASSRTFRFGEKSPSGFPLTKAKIVDMYGFDLGYHPSSLAADPG